LRSPEITTSSFRLRHGVGAGVDGGVHQLHDLAAQFLDLGLQPLPDLLDRHAGEVRVDVVGGFDQLLLRVVRRGEHHPVLHVALGRDDDEEDALFRQPQELDVAEHRRAAGRHHHADELRQVGEQLGRVGDDALRLVGRQAGRGELLALHREHGVDEKAVAAGRGDAPGGGVGTGDQPQVLEVGHHVADGRRRQFQPRSPRQGARAHRLAVGDIALDQRFQQQLGTVIEHGAEALQEF
jgi:hypothetical protein